MRHLLTLALAMLAYAAANPAENAETAKASPQEMLARLREACAKVPLDDRRNVFNNNAVQYWHDRLSESAAAVPFLVTEIMKEGEAHSCYGDVIGFALYSNDTVEATEALFTLAFGKLDLYWARQALEKRRIPCDIPDEMYQKLAGQDDVNDKYVGTTGYPKVLVRCERVPLPKRVDPILEHLRFRVNRFYVTPPTKVPTDMPYNSICVESYLDALHVLGVVGIPAIQAHAAEWAEARDREWFDIFLGYAGEETVAEALKGVIRNSPHRMMRVLAVTAYGHAMKQAAVPFLREIAENDTITGWDELFAIYPLRRAVLRVMCEYDEPFAQEFERTHRPLRSTDENIMAFEKAAEEMEKKK